MKITKDLKALEEKATPGPMLTLGIEKENESLRAENTRLREALKIRAQQIGVACLTHDLTHALECGHCVEQLRAQLGEAREVIEYYGDVHNWNLGRESHGMISGRSYQYWEMVSGMERARAYLEKYKR